MSDWFWKRGPREWSPQMERTLKDCRKLHDAVPREMIVTRSPDGLRKTGQVEGHGHANGEWGCCLIAFLVRIRPESMYCEAVYISWDGRLSMGTGIVQLLNGDIRGFEHLAGRWPWPR